MLIKEESVVSFAFFLQFIVGVNQEISTTSLSDTVYKLESLHKEARIAQKHPQILQDSSKLDPYIATTFKKAQTRIKRTVSLNNGSLCFPLDSCNDRCGGKASVLPFICNCDPLCSYYNDCCSDFENVCELDSNVTTPVFPERHAKPSCIRLFDIFPVITVAKCSPDFPNGFFKRRCTSETSQECRYAALFREENELEEGCLEIAFAKCEQNFRLKCDISIEPKCGPAIARTCRRFSLKVCKTCKSETLPVIGDNGIVYKNSFCAICNFQNVTTFALLDFENITKEFKSADDSISNASITPNIILRKCLPTAIDTCPSMENSTMVNLCSNHSGALISTPDGNVKSILYKNIYCAMCNNASLQSLECAPWALDPSKERELMNGLIRPLIADFVTGDIQGIRMDDIPAAFSILLNFGLDGRERMYISSEGEKDMKYYQELCGSSYIWDPFSNVCRKLYCSTEFVLVDYKCVKREELEGQVSSHNKTAQIPDSDAKFVHLSLSAEMELLDILHFHGMEPSEICENVHDSLCQSFNIKKERIRNVSFNVSVANFTEIEQIMIIVNNMEDSELIKFTIDFDLYEDLATNNTEPEPSVDSIVSMLASALSINGFEFEVNNVTGRIFELHQTVSTLTSWCNPENGGERKEYWNSDFTLVLGNNTSPLVGNKIKGIYVNKTQKFYSSGQFVADILFQGYQFSGNLINVSGLAVVCDWKAKLDEACPRILLERHEYEVLRNGTVLIHNSSLSNRVINNVYEVTDNDSILMCLHTVIPNTTNEFYRMDMDIVQALVSYILSWISIVALSVTFITYTIFPKLRNLPGCNTMNLTFCLVCMQITFVFGQRNTVVGLACKMVALTLHYEILCSLMWMNVIAYDLYQTFGNKYLKCSIRSKAEFLPKYMAYSYVIPFLIIAVATLLDQFVDSDFSPHYGRSDRCWITSKCAAIIFFALPLGLIMFVNFCFFVLTITSIRSVRHNLYLSNQSNPTKGKNEVFLYSRMALVIGLTWATAFAAAYVREEKLTGQILTYCFIIFNNLQGVFIFCVFVCKRSVFELYRKAFRQLARKINCGTDSTSTLSKLANVMKRTVSSDTVVSTISNSSGASNETQLSTLRENDDIIIDSHNV